MSTEIVLNRNVRTLPAQAGGQLPMPPPNSESDAQLAKALAIVQTQDGLLDKAREALKRMLELAQPEPAIPESGHLTEFQRLAAFLQNLAGLELDGVSLFRGGAFTVDTGHDGNKLIMAGIDLHSPVFCLLASASTTGSGQGLRSLITTALKELAIYKSIVAANLNRLAFLALQMDAVRASLHSHQVGRDVPIAPLNPTLLTAPSNSAPPHSGPTADQGGFPHDHAPSQAA